MKKTFMEWTTNGINRSSQFWLLNSLQILLNSRHACVWTHGRHPWNSSDADSKWISPWSAVSFEINISETNERSGESDLADLVRTGEEKRSTQHPEISYGPRESCYTGISSLHRDNLCKRCSFIDIFSLVEPSFSITTRRNAREIEE